jgi:L-fuconolactonase
MKIDSHQHFWKYNPVDYGWINDDMQVLRRDFLPPHLEPELRLNGFQGSVVVQAQQSMEETHWLLELADRYPFIIGVVGWIDLCSPEVERQLGMLVKNPWLVGIRHILQDEPDDNYMLQADFINGLRSLQKYDLTYDLLIFPKHLSKAVQLVAQFPALPFVLDHLAKPLIKNKIISPWKEEMAELAQFPNVWCKVSGMVTEADWQNWKFEDFIPYLDTVFDNFGAGRVLIGSDWPVCTLAGTYQQVMSIVPDYIKKYSPAQQSAVLGENAVRVYKLKIET